MKRKRLAAIVAVTAAALTVTSAAPAYADVDTNFADQLHNYGIYGPRDYNAWLAKITCKRLDRGLDADASAAAHFVAVNAPKGVTQVQAWQFLATAISVYCPDQRPALEKAAA